VLFCTLLAWCLDAPLVEVLERAGHEPEDVSDPQTVIAPARLPNPRSGRCDQCPAQRQCTQDFIDNLPVWCETLDMNDLLVAYSEDRIPQLMARYESFFDDRELAGDADKSARHEAPISASAG